MFDSHSFLTGFAVILSVAFFTWLYQPPQT